MLIKVKSHIKYLSLHISFLLIVEIVFPQIADKTIAIVNGEHIFLSELEKTVKPFILQYNLFMEIAENKSKIDPEKDKKKIKDQILQELIDKKLLLQEAKNKKIKVTKKELDDGINEVKKRFKNEEEFKSELKRENISYKEFEKNIENDLTIIKLIDVEIKSKLPIPTDEETEKYFEMIMKKIKSEKIKDISEEDEKNLEIVAKLIKRHFDEMVRVRHIFIASLKDKKAREISEKKIKDIRERIIKGEDFEKMAELYSEEPLTKLREGDLGYISKLDEHIPKEIKDTAFSLKVGEISEIIETETGFHIIKVEERKAKRKISYDEIKHDLMNFIYQEKARKSLKNYLDHLRSKATIKIFPIE